MHKMLLTSYVHYPHNISVFEELAEEGRRSYKKRLAEFDEKYPDWEEPPPKKKKRMSKKKSTDDSTTSSATPDDTPSNINPKIYARIVSDLSSEDDMLFYPDATVSSFDNHYATTSMPSLLQGLSAAVFTDYFHMIFNL